MTGHHHHHHSDSHSHEDRSHEDMDWHKSHEKGDHDGHHGFWQGCSRRFYGDDDHEDDVKKIALGVSLAVIVLIIIIVTAVVLCCKRQKKKKAMGTKHQKLAEEFDPDQHPKAKEAFPVVVVAPVTQGGKADEAVPNDPRLTLGVWSPPPAYEGKQ